MAGLTDAWKGIKKQAAPGIDRVTAMEFGKNLEENIQDIVAELKEKRYKAKLVRRTYKVLFLRVTERSYQFRLYSKV